MGAAMDGMRIRELEEEVAALRRERDSLLDNCNRLILAEQRWADELDAAWRERDEAREGLRAAAQSLTTVSRAGFRDSDLVEIGDAREYANSRARAAWKDLGEGGS